MREIPLTRGKVALVDDGDFDWLNQHKWCVQFNRGCWYASRRSCPNGGAGFIILMHREIMGFPDGKVDHRDCNGLNNQRSNLRTATNAQNCINRITARAKAIPYKGVYPQKGKWFARVGFDKQKIHLGTFLSPELAAAAYNVAAQQLYGEYARLNVIPQEA